MRVDQMDVKYMTDCHMRTVAIITPKGSGPFAGMRREVVKTGSPEDFRIEIINQARSLKEEISDLVTIVGSDLSDVQKHCGGGITDG